MAEGEARGGAHPWEKSYPDNVDWNAPLPKSPLQRLLDDAVARFADRPAIDFMDRITTYRELGDLANRAAEGFQKLGVSKGTKVGILLPNCPAFVAVYYGVLKAGGTVVNVNPLYAIEEIKSQIEDSETDILVTLDLSILYDKARIALDQTRLTHLVICPMADMLPGLKKLLFPLVKRSEIAKIPRDSHHVFFRKLTDNAGRPTPVEIEVDDDIAVLQYTGGTTGTSKGAMLTHANLSANVAQAAMMMPDAEEGTEVMVGVLPLFHVFAMAVVMNFSIKLGAKMILLPRFELDTVLNVIHKKRPTFFPAVPTIYIAINGHPDVAAGKYDLSSIKFCLSGGASLPREVQEKFQELSGLHAGGRLWAQRDLAGRDLQPDQPRRQPRRLARRAGAQHGGRDLLDRRSGPGAPPGRDRRDLHLGPPGDEGLLEARRGERPCLRRRSLPHRRYRPDR